MSGIQLVIARPKLWKIRTRRFCKDKLRVSGVADEEKGTYLSIWYEYGTVIDKAKIEGQVTRIKILYTKSKS